MEPKPQVTPIAALQDGQLATVRGEVRPAPGGTLTSPVGGRPCVYYVVVEGLSGGDQEQARDFYVEDASGRALVVMERYRMELAGQLEKLTIDVLDADINEVAEELREIKQRLRQAIPAEQRELRPRQKMLRRLATLLYAVRAHRRGNVHQGDSLQVQEAFIREQSEAFTDEKSRLQSLQLTVERQEVTLEQGQPVLVTGLCQQEPTRDAGAVAGGYRGVAMRLSIRAPSGGELLVQDPAPRARLPAAPPAPAVAQQTSKVNYGLRVAGLAMGWALLMLLVSWLDFC